MTSEVNFGLWSHLGGLIEYFSNSSLTIHNFLIPTNFWPFFPFQVFRVRQVPHHYHPPFMNWNKRLFTWNMLTECLFQPTLTSLVLESSQETPETLPSLWPGYTSGPTREYRLNIFVSFYYRIFSTLETLEIVPYSCWKPPSSLLWRIFFFAN